jgi:hypothetical protein
LVRFEGSFGAFILLSNLQSQLSRLRKNCLPQIMKIPDKFFWPVLSPCGY